jgi:hypothetical protein
LNEWEHGHRRLGGKRLEEGSPAYAEADRGALLPARFISPKRIIACGPGYQGKYQHFYYSFDKKIINGLVRAGHAVIPLSDREITRSVGGIRAIGRLAVERQLLSLARSFAPDVVVLLQADQVPNSALLAVKSEYPNCLIVNVDCDAIINDERMQRLTMRRGIVDATLITSAGQPLDALRHGKLRAGFIPNPTDASLENADVYTHPDKFFDLIYVCANYKIGERWDLIRDIAREAPDLKVGSFGADKRRVLGQDYFNVLRSSRCALNWSHRNDVHLYSSDRISQLFGAGACVCMPRSIGFEMFLGDDDAIFFSDSDELIAKLRRIKSTEEWVDIAKQGQRTYRALFNETRVARYIMDFAFDVSLREYEWGAL